MRKLLSLFFTVFSLSANARQMVQIASINGYAQGDSLVLSWRVLNELADITYEIQQSSDGRSFHTVDTLLSPKELYRLSWKTRLGGTYYMRLRYSSGATVEYSRTMMATIPFSQPVLYPNPGCGMVRVGNVPDNARIRLLSLTGILLRDVTGTTLDVSSLSRGNYHIVVTEGEKILLSENFLKN